MDLFEKSISLYQLADVPLVLTVVSQMVKVAEYLLEESGQKTESLDGYETSQ